MMNVWPAPGSDVWNWINAPENSNKTLWNGPPAVLLQSFWHWGQLYHNQEDAIQAGTHINAWTKIDVKHNWKLIWMKILLFGPLDIFPFCLHVNCSLFRISLLASGVPMNTAENGYIQPLQSRFTKPLEMRASQFKLHLPWEMKT